MSIATTTVTTGGGDYRWLQSARGTDHPKGGTLDYSAFTEGTHFPNGYFPSGLALAKITATGLYAPWTGGGAVTKVQTLTRSSTSGELKLNVDGEQTGELTGSAAAFIKANIDAALLALSNVNPGDFTSVQTSATVLTITGDIPDITVTDVDMVGGTVVAAVATPEATTGVSVLAGFLYHDVAVNGTNDLPAAILTDVTIDASACPVTTGLSDGRYICDAVAVEA